MAASTAEAGRGLPFPVPCLGEGVVKVLDVPAAATPVSPPALSGAAPVRMVHVDLGYKFSHCFWGEWVGYTGDHLHYQPLTGERLTLLLRAAGRSELPPEPFYLAHPAESWRVWFWIVVFGFVAARAAWRRGKSDPATAKTAKAVPYSGPDYWSPEAIAARQRELGGIILPVSEPRPAQLSSISVELPEHPAAQAPGPALPSRTARVLGASRPAPVPNGPPPRTVTPSPPSPVERMPVAVVSARPPRIFGKRPAA